MVSIFENLADWEIIYFKLKRVGLRDKLFYLVFYCKKKKNYIKLKVRFDDSIKMHD